MLEFCGSVIWKQAIGQRQRSSHMISLGSRWKWWFHEGCRNKKLTTPLKWPVNSSVDLFNVFPSSSQHDCHSRKVSNVHYQADRKPSTLTFFWVQYMEVLVSRYLYGMPASANVSTLARSIARTDAHPLGTSASHKPRSPYHTVSWWKCSWNLLGPTCSNVYRKDIRDWIWFDDQVCTDRLRMWIFVGEVFFQVSFILSRRWFFGGESLLILSTVKSSRCACVAIRPGGCGSSRPHVGTWPAFWDPAHRTRPKARVWLDDFAKRQGSCRDALTLIVGNEEKHHELFSTSWSGMLCPCKVG